MTVFPVAAFISLFLLLLTVPHHWRIRSFATLSIIAWLAIHNFAQGVNATIWETNVNPGGLAMKIWCDIGTKLSVGAKVGLPGSCLCLQRRLYQIVSGQEDLVTTVRNRAVNIGFCWAIPVLVMSLHIIVQGHRFDLIETLGCSPAIYSSWLSLVILDFAVFLCGLLSTIYSARTFDELYARHRTVRMRIQYHTDSAGSKCAMTFASFIRLLVVTFLIGTLTTGFAAYHAYLDWTEGLKPWASWSFVHSDFNTVWRYPMTDFTDIEIATLYIFWWPWPIGAIVFFLLFGLARETREEWTLAITRFFPNRKKEPAPKEFSPDWSVDVEGATSTRSFGEVLYLKPESVESASATLATSRSAPVEAIPMTTAGPLPAERGADMLHSHLDDARSQSVRPLPMLPPRDIRPNI
ncbi:Fungal pheromone STE3G-protein-coupled receptor [Mycena indigotica]|uniref:Fungal pheromone STE3G-protein-coupled receptor n=1 Tax=Mycena indigotica TaxID=2126181 RepID=A0A8H6W2Q4_9AGAR|nr:Fungal pheromone STE3G-protein-coupled receptor [Mycena indigotica]KAF7299508.1 Fungal pheromone STE3G-protein-coupled receptor [Mycena indigotica]